MEWTPAELWMWAQSAGRSVPLFLAQPWAGGGLAGLASGGVTGALLHRHYARRAQVLPYIPSLAEALDGPHDETTRFLSAVHEMTMSVTDAWNAARARKVSREPVEALLRRDALLPACQQVHDQAPAVRERYAGFAVLADVAAEAEALLMASWSYQSRDNYRTEHYTVTTRDSKGNTKTEVRSRQVYENTDHWFTFDRSMAQRADAALGELLDVQRVERLDLPRLTKLRVRPRKLPEAQRMFLRRMVRDTVLEDPEVEVSDAQVARYANQWILGAGLPDRLLEMLAHEAALRKLRGPQMAEVLESQATYHYRTGSRSHSGPPGFQAARLVQRQARALRDAWSAVSEMVERCVEVAADLLGWANDASRVESDRKYLKRAAEAYELAFPNSLLEVDQLARHGVTIGVGVGVAILVGAAVFFGLGGQL